MSTPRQERGILPDIYARCGICNIRDHKVQMIPYVRTDMAFPAGVEPVGEWLCSNCGWSPNSGDEEGQPDGDEDDGQGDPISPDDPNNSDQGDGRPHGFQIGQENPSGLQPPANNGGDEPPEEPRPRSRRASRN